MKARKADPHTIASLTLSKKASDVLIMDLRKVTSMTDYFVICSGDSDTQVKAIADAVIEGMEKRGVKVWHSEGYMYRNWILLDFVDVVVHIFKKGVREFYNLEKLWGDAEVEYIADKPVRTKKPMGRVRRTARSR